MRYAFVLWRAVFRVVQEERRRQHIRSERAAREASLAAKAGQLSAIRRLASAQAEARKAAATGQRAQTGANCQLSVQAHAAQGVCPWPSQAQLVFLCHGQVGSLSLPDLVQTVSTASLFETTSALTSLPPH